MKAKKSLFTPSASIGDLCRQVREALDQTVWTEEPAPKTDPEEEKQRALLWLKLKAQLENLGD